MSLGFPSSPHTGKDSICRRYGNEAHVFLSLWALSVFRFCVFAGVYVCDVVHLSGMCVMLCVVYVARCVSFYGSACPLCVVCGIYFHCVVRAEWWVTF